MDLLESVKNLKRRLEAAYDKVAIKDNESGMIEAAIAISIGLIVLVAIFSIAPVIGDSIDNSVTIDNTSAWAAADIPSGAALWTQNANMLSLAVMISILALVIFTIMRLRGGGGVY